MTNTTQTSLSVPTDSIDIVQTNVSKGIGDMKQTITDEMDTLYESIKKVSALQSALTTIDHCINKVQTSLNKRSKDLQGKVDTLQISINKILPSLQNISTMTNTTQTSLSVLTDSFDIVQTTK